METSKLKEKLPNNLRRVASSLGISREDLMKNYKNDNVNFSWEAFSRFIEKNYNLGKGTIIPSFGIFTFTNVEVNLEGTTNEKSRDLKPRIPVFIMSNAFCDSIKSGIFINGNVLPYTHKSTDSNMSHVKLSYSEIAISVGITKNEIEVIIQNCLKYISEAIIKVFLYYFKS